VTIHQKTWTELLGPYVAGTHTVDGRYLVALEGDAHYRVLWSFDTPTQAREVLYQWWKETHGHGGTRGPAL